MVYNRIIGRFMKKKNIIIIVSILVLIILLVPIKFQYKDGGTRAKN